MMLRLTPERFPFQYRGKRLTVGQVEFFMRFKDLTDTRRFKTGTALGDFVSAQGSKGLQMYLTPSAFAPGQQPQAPSPPPPPPNGQLVRLMSAATTYNATPHAATAPR